MRIHFQKTVDLETMLLHKFTRHSFRLFAPVEFRNYGRKFNSTEKSESEEVPSQRILFRPKHRRFLNDGKDAAKQLFEILDPKENFDRMTTMPDFDC